MTPLSSSSDDQPLDALIIGTGFSGTYLLHALLKLDYRVLALDANAQLGGVWTSNTYPGARVDIEVPVYELNIPELWDHPDGGWIWKERFPGSEELRRYFAFVEGRLGLREYCVFETWVESAVWDDAQRVWTVRSRDGREWRARFLLPCLGYAAKPFVPPLKDLEQFEGVWTHTACWAKEGVELEGKRVGVIGTGASGVQVIQTIAPVVKELTVFQQTPATAVPMQQRDLSPEESTKSSPDEKRQFFDKRKTQWDGSFGSMIPRSAQDDSPEQRDIEFTRLWNQGGFSFWTSNYMDLFGVEESNDIVYEWWRDQTRKRIEDPKKRAILAPNDAPYAFGTKRVPLEQNYYEAFNLPHVSLINLREDPIKEVQPNGLLTQSNTLHNLDVLILATGFDISTGSFTQLNIRGHNGQSLAETWSHRTKTYLGLSVSRFPNMLFPYGPQSPSNTCNGPVCAEIQGRWIVDALQYLRKKGKSRIEAEAGAEEEYTDLVTGMLKGTLFEGTRSYYHADNVPRTEGRKREPVFWMGGLPGYMGKCEEVAKDGYRGFRIS